MSWLAPSGAIGWRGNRHRPGRAGTRLLSWLFAGGGSVADEELRSPSVTLRVVYDDLPDLIEVEARVVADDWSGVTRAYTAPVSLGEEARGLLAWAERPREEFALEAGADTGIGWLSLRWYAIDRAGHLACHVRIATRAETSRPESVRRLCLEFSTEPSQVERFARQLASLAESLAGEAVLIGG
jgi:hypothetical protein